MPHFFDNVNCKSILEFLDLIPGVFFWIKDLEGRYQYINDRNVSSYNKKKLNEIIGKTDFDFWPKDHALVYRKDDQKILEGHILINKLEPLSQPDWSIKWYLVTKKALRDTNNKIIGTIGYSREVEGKNLSGILLKKEFLPALEHIKENINKKITIPELAKLSCLSVSAFERNFKKNFVTTPVEYIKQARLHLMCQYLLKTNESVSELAKKCGFHNPGFMTRSFKKAFGMTPSKFRRQYK